jgi:hypothetical protein
LIIYLPFLQDVFEQGFGLGVSHQHLAAYQNGRHSKNLLLLFFHATTSFLLSLWNIG